MTTKERLAIKDFAIWRENEPVLEEEFEPIVDEEPDEAEETPLCC